MAGSDLADGGRAAARQLWHEGIKAVIDDPFLPDFAEAAVAEFARLQSLHTPGILRDVLEGAEMSAEQLNPEPFHGVVEVLQNADDEKAGEVRMAVRTRSGRSQLLFAHDGEPVRLTDLVAMALAFVSPKRHDAMKKGRFGIGLKTLRALGDTLNVFCGPYHASITGNHLKPAPPAGPIAGFFRPESGETLLELELRPGFDAVAFADWLRDWDASSLVFLDTIRSAQLIDLRTRGPIVHLRLQVGRPEEVAVKVGSHELHCERVGLKDPASGRTWHRYWVERPVPASAPRRRHKVTGSRTPLAMAVPDQPGEQGRLFAGLPLQAALGFPFSLNAQFNVDTARSGMLHDDWNGWLLDRLMEFMAAVARERFDREPATGWMAVPLVSESDDVREPWLRERLTACARGVQVRLVRSLTFDIDGTKRRLRDLVFEARPFERILGASEFAELHPDLVMLPWRMRDPGGRWRAVLAELGVATEVGVQDALQLLDLEDNALEARPVSWFIRFARAVIGTGNGGELWWRRAVVLADGTRIVPPLPAAEGEVLLSRARPGSLAVGLGVARVIHPAYLTENPEAATVRRWLEESAILGDDLGDEPALRALARRGTGESPPIDLSDENLVSLRQALAKLDPRDQEELGPEIGLAITVRGFRWERGQRVRIRVCPAHAYIPASLEDRPAGWAKAAGMTPDVEWIEPRYAEILKRETDDRRTPGALLFFRVIGAEVAPRLITPSTVTQYGEPASPIGSAPLTASQAEALAGVHATHLTGNLLAPDLAHVVDDMSRQRPGPDRLERARALLATLDREWRRIYEGHETARAVYASRGWRGDAEVPASWIAVARDTPWLTTEAAVSARPRDLAVRTRLTEALYGREYPRFVEEIGPEMATSPAIRALGLTTEPPVSEIIEQLAELRASSDPVDPSVAAVRYAALASAVPSTDLDFETMVGDLTVRQLRVRLGGDPRKPGLILVDGEWLRPSQVLRGRPIFGRRRAFVPDRSLSDRLWRALGISAPAMSDCVKILDEIARATPSQEDEQILLDTYVHMSQHLSEASRAEVQAIAVLPLWTGRGWLTQRPVYWVEDATLGQHLAESWPVWQPPMSPGSLGALIEALKVTLLTDSHFTALVGEREVEAGEAVRDMFQDAVAHLRDWLARHDQELDRALEVRWEDLAQAEIALSAELQLRLQIADRRPVRLPARGHVGRSPLRFSIAETADLGSYEVGGRAVATLFPGGDRDKVALAWADAWSRAQAGEGGARMRRAEEERADQSLEVLFQQAAQRKRPASRPPAAAPSPREEAAPAGQTKPTAEEAPVRRLKAPDDLIVSTVTLRDSQGRPVSRGPRGLRSDKSPGRPIKESLPAPRASPLAYSPEDKQRLALIFLSRAVNGELSDLKDFSHLRGIGADAMDRLERAFEIKSYAGVMPDQVNLTANEAKKAFAAGSKYFLAVVAGLEEGYETVARIIVDPLRTLEVGRSTTVVLRGIRSTERAIDVRFSPHVDRTESP